MVFVFVGLSAFCSILLPFVFTNQMTFSLPCKVVVRFHLFEWPALLLLMQMFGREAAKLLDFVECFPDGYRKGTIIAKACADVGIEGFPTWVINGEVRNLYAPLLFYLSPLEYFKLRLPLFTRLPFWTRHTNYTIRLVSPLGHS